MNEFEAVIGLEVHAQLVTDSKIFASSSTVAGESPNSLTDSVTLGLPGSLPVLNRRVVDFAIKLGLATNSSIRERSVFERKHYHYPDLPKGYQISQYQHPICEHGRVVVRLGEEKKSVGLTRIHLEEDAGKNVHLENDPISVVDLNRAGVPLLEIVSEPDMRTPQEAGSYMRQLRQILQYLDICDGNMEEGSLRCDANVSVRKMGGQTLGTKVEIKNLNSFRHVEKAIEHEITRQISAVMRGESIVQETRLWDEGRGMTRSMRSKEYAEDYRYFPDPDLLPLVVDDDWIDRIRSTMPELPSDVFERFRSVYKLEVQLAETLTEEKLVAQYYDRAVGAHNNPVSIANWITTELFGRLHRDELAMKDCPVSPENLAALVRLIDDQVISGKIAKSVFEEMFSRSVSPLSIIESKGLHQITDTDQIRISIQNVIQEHADQVNQYKEGKTKVLGFLIGQIMKQTKGKANPQIVNDMLLEMISK